MMVTAWLGLNAHCVFYPLRGGEQFNLVLLGPDDLPPGAKTGQGDIGEMRALFGGWDERCERLQVQKLSEAVRT